MRCGRERGAIASRPCAARAGLTLSLLALGLGLALAGCAGAGARDVAGAEAGRPPVQPEDKRPPAEHERIVSSFQVHPEAIVYLTPVMAERHLARCDDAAAMEGVLAKLERLGDLRAEAAARLNLGAVYWCGGEGDEAYGQLKRAEALFTRAADLDGVARVHEWLGFMLLQSHEAELAAEHLAAAYQVFLRLEDAESTARVLAYGE